jgi:hypothetical protein
VQFMRRLLPCTTLPTVTGLLNPYMALILYISALALWVIGIQRAMRKPKW